MISIIVAMARNGVIGRDNSLIWHLPADLKYFKETTMGSPVIMGRKTYESVGRPLPGRTNIIVTRREGYSAEGCLVAGSLEEAVEMARRDAGNAASIRRDGGSSVATDRKDAAKEIFIAGGGEIYRQAMGIADKIYITFVDGEFEGDTFFPPIPEREWKLVDEKHRPPDDRNKYPLIFRVYNRKKDF